MNDHVQHPSSLLSTIIKSLLLLGQLLPISPQLLSPFIPLAGEPLARLPLSKELAWLEDGLVKS